MATLNFDFFKQLDEPHKAVTKDLWSEWTRTIMSDKNLGKITEFPIKDIAPYLGITWKNQNNTKIKELLRTPFQDIQNPKHKPKWYKKSAVLLVVKLTELTNEDFDRLSGIINKDEIEAEQLREQYDTVRGHINFAIDKFGRALKSDDFDFDQEYKNLMSRIVKHLFSVKEFRTKNPEKYISSFAMRFYNQASYKEIREKLGIESDGIINTMLNKFREEFNKMYDTHEKKTAFAKKWQNIYDNLFEVLPADNLTERNNKLNKLKDFGQYMIGDFRQYID